MKIIKAIQLDESDLSVYEKCAEPGEYCVTGSFCFLDDSAERLSGKRKLAFVQGFMGVESLGWTSLVQIVKISEKEYRQTVELLAHQFVDSFGAPSIDAALPVAREEVNYAVELCEHPESTLIALSREFHDQDGIVESIRVIRPDASDHVNISLWAPEPE